MKSILEDALKNMQNKIKDINKQPIFFIGSGISRRYLNLMDWTGLLKEICQEIGYQYDGIEEECGGDNEKIAHELEYYCFRKAEEKEIANKNRRVILREKIGKIVNRNDNIIETDTYNKEYRDEIKALKQTRPAAIITTNYDTLLERIFDNGYQVHIGQEDIMIKNIEEGDIYKVHGCVTKPESIVITKEDYDNFFQNSKYLYSKLLTLFWEYPLIFMGYSISDRNIKDILTSIVEVMTEKQVKEFSERIWVLGYTENKDNEEYSTKQIELLNGKNIEVNYFQTKNYQEIFEKISEVTTSQKFGELKFSISEDVINLLIEPLYEQQDKLKVVTRELLQNALDACKKKKIEAKIKIRVVREGNNCFLEVHDNGIGMDLQEVRENFLTVGRSSKKGSNEGLVGKYGIGILSVFLIGDYAELYTKKKNNNLLKFKLYINEGKKQVAWLDDSMEELLGIMNKESYTIIRVNITNKEGELSDKSLEDIIRWIGMENYVTNEKNSISIEYKGDTWEVSKLEKEPWFYLEQEEEIGICQLKWKEPEVIYKKSKELQRILKKDNVVFFNDMISDVKYNKENFYQLKEINIPFLLLNMKNSEDKNLGFTTNLSRSIVEIGGKLMEKVARGIYHLEIEKLIEILSNSKKIGLFEIQEIYDIRKKIQTECKIIKQTCDIFVYNNKLYLTKKVI